jgi:hypothetical protein
MPRNRTILHSLAVMTLVPAVVAAAVLQAPRVLDKPQAELAEPFTNVGSVRELRDGRVLVVDNGDRALYVVDFTAGTSTQVGRPGSGPAEYRIPGTLLALAGDTTLLTDAGNNRLLVLGPDARPVTELTEAWPLPNGRRGTRLPRAIDGQGRGYFFSSPARAEPTTSTVLVQQDTVALVRAHRGAAVEDSVGYIHLAPRRITTTATAGKLTGVQVMTMPFPAQDAWQAFADGAVAIARVRDYRVEWLLPDGRRVTGRPIAFDRVKVTELDTRELVVGARSARSGGSPGGAPAGGGSPPALHWPEVKPPFPFSGVLAGTDGRLWVLRHGRAGDPRVHYDVIDRQGAVAVRVDVPNGCRIVGFGARSIYVVRKDADDLQYLQRFPL